MLSPMTGCNEPLGETHSKPIDGDMHNNEQFFDNAHGQIEAVHELFQGSLLDRILIGREAAVAIWALTAA